MANAPLLSSSMEMLKGLGVGSFLTVGTGQLLHCEKSINALEYRKILQKFLLATIE